MTTGEFEREVYRDADDCFCGHIRDADYLAIAGTRLQQLSLLGDAS